MIICRFQVIQISRELSLSISVLLEPYGVSSPPYIESKWNLHWWEAKSLTLWWKYYRSTKRTQRLANQHFFFHSKPKYNLECPVHGIINSCEIEGAYLGRVLSIFWPKKKKIRNDFFSEKKQQKKKNKKKKKKTKHFSTFERWIITCFIVAVFRLFTILCFLKNRHNPCRSVRTLDQYMSNSWSKAVSCTGKLKRTESIYNDGVNMIVLRSEKHKWVTSKENLFLPYANNKGAVQPVHPRSLISIFVIHGLDNNIK